MTVDSGRWIVIPTVHHIVPERDLMSCVSLVITAGEMTEPLSWDTGEGHAVVFSTPCRTRTTENEDSALVIEPRPGAVVMAVADGAGGHASGAHASRIAINSLSEALEHVDPSAPEEGSSERLIRSVVLDAIEQANAQIYALGIGAATTLTVALIEAGVIRSFQIGDSKLLVTGQRGRLRYETIAHSPIGYAIESGMMAETEAIDHEDLHVVSNMAGTSDMRIEVGPSVKLKLRDTVILGTDGLFDNAYQREIIEEVRKGALERASRNLTQLCFERMSNPGDGDPSKPDDLTFIVFRPKKTD
jgi:serine/threonine protein phosphatase PrpC